MRQPPLLWQSLRPPARRHKRVIAGGGEDLDDGSGQALELV
jgi:hypothetical protein